MVDPEQGSTHHAGETGSFETGRVLTITGVHAVHDTYTTFLPPLLPAFVSKSTLCYAQAGALTVFLQPYMGYLADRMSLRYFVILGPAIAAVNKSMLGIAPECALLPPGSA